MDVENAGITCVVLDEGVMVVEDEVVVGEVGITVIPEMVYATEKPIIPTAERIMPIIYLIFIG